MLNGKYFLQIYINLLIILKKTIPSSPESPIISFLNIYVNMSGLTKTTWFSNQNFYLSPLAVYVVCVCPPNLNCCTEKPSYCAR